MVRKPHGLRLSKRCNLCRSGEVMAKREEVVKVEIELTAEQATALAQFIKRLMLSDCEAKCSPTELKAAMHYTMQSALFDVGTALADKGFNPR